jgi:hypothetical protein
MAEDNHVTAGEFTRAFESIERQMTAGFERTSREIGNVSRGLHKRLDLVDKETREQGEDIAGLKVRVATAEKGNRKSASGWGGAIAGAVMLIVEAAKAALGR